MTETFSYNTWNLLETATDTVGIDAARIKIVSYGEELPIDTASNEEAWFKNRRAEFKREN